ncbi:hypothetical protein [Magnetospirillum sp. UT-4]|uniref:hypothetical protein n=1 Tax=Magnetospirillum sp. UT-4 TaxID=2681467 RepID=UPI0013863BED|nr:hypothetical protein [Magnetospirillum sp. UT-4]CAA7617616.1 hypothetical protein MTBUT4_260035 [Magnetospirillum sp. UT-4]
MGGFGSELLSPTALGGPAASRRSLLKVGQSALMGLPPEAALRDTQVRQDFFRHLVTGRTMEAIEAERTGRPASLAATHGPQVAASVLSVVFPPAGAAMQAGLALGDQVDRTFWSNSRSSAAGLQQGLQTRR